MHTFHHWIGYLTYWRALVARDWCSPFIIKPGNSRYFFVSWYDVLISCVTAFISYVYKFCAVGESHVTLAPCTFHPHWIFVSCGGKCGVSPLKIGTDKTHFQRRDDTLRKTALYTYLKWYVIFIRFSNVCSVFYNNTYTVYFLSI